MKCKMCGSCCKTIAFTMSPEDISRRFEKVIKKYEKGEEIDWGDYDIYFSFFNLKSRR